MLTALLDPTAFYRSLRSTVLFLAGGLLTAVTTAPSVHGQPILPHDGVVVCDDEDGQLPTIEYFDLSERSSYVEIEWTGEIPHIPNPCLTIEEPLRYFSSSARYTACADCPTGAEPECRDCYWARCDQYLEEPLTLTAMRAYVEGLGDADLLRHVADRASLVRLVKREPPTVLQNLLPQSRTEWNAITLDAHRDRLIEFKRDCSRVRSDPLLFTVVLRNTADQELLVTAVDYSRAIPRPPTPPLPPTIDYTQEEWDRLLCLPDPRGFRLDPPLVIAPGSAESFELHPVFGSINLTTPLIPMMIYLSLDTSEGRVDTPVFVVEVPSCPPR